MCIDVVLTGWLTEESECDENGGDAFLVDQVLCHVKVFVVCGGGIFVDTFKNGWVYCRQCIREECCWCPSCDVVLRTTVTKRVSGRWGERARAVRLSLLDVMINEAFSMFRVPFHADRLFAKE